MEVAVCITVMCTLSLSTWGHLPLQSPHPASRQTLQLFILCAPSPYHPHSSLIRASFSFKLGNWLLSEASPKSHPTLLRCPPLWPPDTLCAPLLHLAHGGDVLHLHVCELPESECDPIHFTALGPHPGPGIVCA